MSKFYFFFLLFVFCQCAQKDQKDYKVFRYNQINHITSLDPAFAKSQNNIWGVHQLYNRLVTLDSNLNIIPDLAKKWEIDHSGRIYTFHLREDVPFHENECFGQKKSRKFIADDVVYSLNRIISPTLASPGSWLFSDKLDSIIPFSAPDDSTFVMKLSTPFLPMLGILSMEYCAIVPKEAVDFYATEFRSNPVGTGPFKFKRWEENQAMYFVKNPNYFHKNLVQIDGVKTLFIPDKKIAFLEILNGNLDYVSGLESSFINELLTRNGELKNEKTGILQYRKAPYLNMEYFGINLTALPPDSPLQNKLFRQALNFAIDRQLMMSSLRNNVGKPANAGFVPFGLPSFDEEKVKGYTYDLTKAKSLLDKSGYLENENPESLVLFTNKDYLDLTTFVAKQWERIGVKVEIDVLESSLLRDGMRKSSIPFFRASWIADYPDPESFLCMFYSKNPPPPNYTRYNNPDYDVLYEKAISEPDKDKRIALYQEMDRKIVEDAPVIFLFYDQSANFYSKRIAEIENNAINMLEIDQIRIN
jgi:peptide/nickel transport system substrate-binding protein